MDLIKEYKNIQIWRQAAIVFMAAPIPAALVKLQGTLLTENLIALIMISGSIMSMCTPLVNKLSLRTCFIAGNVILLIAVGLLAGLYLQGIDTVILIVGFPVAAGFGFMIQGQTGVKITEGLKNKYAEQFDLSEFTATKAMVCSAAGLLGQLMALVFYSLTSYESIVILVILEMAKCLSYTVLEIRRWKILKELGIA